MIKCLAGVLFHVAMDTARVQAVTRLCYSEPGVRDGRCLGAPVTGPPEGQFRAQRSGDPASAQAGSA
jgi:hypothetical protein